MFVSELLRGAKKSLKYPLMVAFANALQMAVQELAGTWNALPPPLPPRKGPATDPYEIEALEDAFRQEKEETPDEALPTLFRKWRHKSFREKGSVEGPIPLFVAGQGGSISDQPV